MTDPATPRPARPRRAWLLPVAIVVLVAGDAAAETRFTNVTAQAGLDEPFDVQGVAWGDVDNDGDHDVYQTLVLSAILGTGKRLYRNDGDTDGDGYPNFVEIAGAAGVSDDQTGFGACFADFDEDTDDDLVTANGALVLLPDALRLYVNDGRGSFVDESGARGLTAPGSGRSITWADFDNDGDVDIFLATPALEDQYLLRNDGGTFADVTGPAGVGKARSTNNASGAAWADYDDDGDQDLYVANAGLPFFPEDNRLYRNDGLGTFTEVGAAAGVTQSEYSNGAAWGDCDNDGDLDLYVANGGVVALFSLDAPNQLYRNNGDGTFTDVAPFASVEDSIHVSFSVTWGDFDNDGWLDLYVTNSPLNSSRPGNRLFRNLGNCTFEDVSDVAGVSDPGSGQGTATADYDGDGDLDIFVANLFTDTDITSLLYRNDSTPRHWLVVDTIGTDSNRDGIGAKLQVHAGAQAFTRHVNAGSGYLSQDSLDVELGLGDLLGVDDLTIRWPSGCVQVIPGPAIDRKLVVVEDCVPGFDRASYADDPCGPGLVVSWEEAAFASGSGHYEVRRGADCADASRQPELLPRPTGTTYTDAVTTPGTSYAYLVTARDDGNDTFTEQCVAGAIDADGSVFATDARADPNPVCPGRDVTFQGTGPAGATFAWDLDGDGTDDATGATVTHAFATPGMHGVRVTVTSAEGCPRTADVVVEVRSDLGPVVDLDSLRVARVGPADPRLRWSVVSGTGRFAVRRSLVARDFLPVPPTAPVVATPSVPDFLDTDIPLVPGQVAFYQVFGGGCD
jgi:hypothetical protein